MDPKLYALLRRDVEANYSPTTAAHYRQQDELAKDHISQAGKCQIIRELSLRFSRPITVLDLGCGTGRYFHCPEHIKCLVGVDPAGHMLLEAKKAVMGGHAHLIRSTLHEVAFQSGSFDLVICVGVLGLWCPLDPLILQRVAEMLRPDGIFFCTIVEYDPVPRTWKRRVATAARPFLFGPPRRYIDRRLRAFTMSEPRVSTLGRRSFEQVTITRWQSPTTRVDLHCVLARPRR